MAHQLKVFRTPIGFHDAYVAAPSQKAALEACGADVDLFARGLAERITDADLAREPLEKPGVVIRKRRGTNSEFEAALPKASSKPRRRRSPATTADEGPPARKGRGSEDMAVRPEVKSSSARNRRTKRSSTRRSRPRLPSRTKLDAAEARLERAEATYEANLESLRERERAIVEERRALSRRHDDEVAKLEQAIVHERERYRAALRE